MAYVKLGTNISNVGPAASSDSDYLMVDGKSVPFGTAVQASATGFGFIDPITGTFEILDALPLGRESARNAIEAASDIVFASNVDNLTSAEIIASAGRIKGSMELVPDTPPAPLAIIVTLVNETVRENWERAIFNFAGGAGLANTTINLEWFGTVDRAAGAGAWEDYEAVNVMYSDGQTQGVGDLPATSFTLDGDGNGEISFLFNNDTFNEGNETLGVNASYPGYTTGTATVTITD